MDIDKPLTPVDAPVFNIDAQTLAEIASIVERKLSSHTVTDEEAKQALNALYSTAVDSLHRTLDSCNAASWVLEAYKQAFMWTIVYKQEMSPLQISHAPLELAPTGRYGWRYAIEHLLPKVATNRLHKRRPHYEDVSKAFTAIAVMTAAAEWSNLLHFFPDVYSGIYVDLNFPEGALSPKVPPNVRKLISERNAYLNHIDWKTWEKYPELNLELTDSYVRSWLNSGLKNSMGFSLDNLETVIKVLSEEILSSGFTIVHAGEYLIEWVSDVADLPRKIVSKIFDFMLLSVRTTPEINQNYLNKKDPARMINFAGVRIDRLQNVKSIYAKTAARKTHIKKASWHVIMNLFMVAEWFDVFQHRCSVGHRPDLKMHPQLNLALESIEQYQRQKIFEKIVAKILLDHGFKCVNNLKKWRNEKGEMAMLPCGEIDIVAYHEKAKVLLVIECKAGAPAVDARGYSQQYKDHFNNKRYHYKFINKIDWIASKKEDLDELGKVESGFAACEPLKIIPILVTKYPSVVRFYAKEYEVKTFVELEKEINEIVGL
jgi:Holliday junction resolvase-like predicted endonuclease